MNIIVYGISTPPWLPYKAGRIIMAQPTDQKLQDDLARNFRELNDYIGNKYTHRHRQQFVDLILHCIFNSLPNDIVQLPLTGKDAKQLDLHVTEATRSFIDDYAYDLWPRLSLEAEGDFALALYWIVKDFVRNAFRIKTDAYAARDRPAELKRSSRFRRRMRLLKNGWISWHCRTGLLIERCLGILNAAPNRWERLRVIWICICCMRDKIMVVRVRESWCARDSLEWCRVDSGPSWGRWMGAKAAGRGMGTCSTSLQTVPMRSEICGRLSYIRKAFRCCGRLSDQISRHVLDMRHSTDNEWIQALTADGLVLDRDAEKGAWWVLYSTIHWEKCPDRQCTRVFILHARFLIEMQRRQRDEFILYAKILVQLFS